MHKYDAVTSSPSIKVHATVYTMPIISTSGSENISMARAAHIALAWLFTANAALLAVLISVGRYWMSTWLELQRLQTGRASTKCVIIRLFVCPQIHAWACGKSKSLTISHCQVSRYLHHDKDLPWEPWDAGRNIQDHHSEDSVPWVHSIPAIKPVFLSPLWGFLHDLSFWTFL